MAATTWVALVRGINLGRAKRVAMADLRALLESLGYDEVKTLLQSGNAVFSTSGRSGTLESQIESGIEGELGLDVTVLVRSARELVKVVAANPFARAGVDPKQLHALFLSARPPAKAVSGLNPADHAPDEFEFGDRVVYLRLPNGVAGMQLPDLERALDLRATMRTWNTVTKLNDLAGR